MQILVFDSGVGGLTIYKEIINLLPHADIVYCLDNAAFPYSEKTESTLIHRVNAVCQQIAQRISLDLIVIACNTASTVVLPSLRQRFTCPVVGTVPAIKPAAALSQTGHIALLATKGTVNRPYTQRLIDTFAPKCNVEKFGSTQLVEMAEHKLLTGTIDQADLNAHLQALQIPTLDTVVLGCTHFPLLKTELQQALPQVKYWVDSGFAIAKRVQQLVSLCENQNSTAQKVCFSTAELSPMQKKIFTQRGFQPIENLKMALE